MNYYGSPYPLDNVNYSCSTGGGLSHSSISGWLPREVVCPINLHPLLTNTSYFVMWVLHSFSTIIKCNPSSFVGWKRKTFGGRKAGYKIIAPHICLSFSNKPIIASRWRRLGSIADRRLILLSQVLVDLSWWGSPKWRKTATCFWLQCSIVLRLRFSSHLSRMGCIVW